VLGLTVSATIPFGPNDAVAQFGHTEGGQSRVAVVKVPGLAMGVELIEYKDIARTAQNPRFYDPGAANLALRVRNLDTLFPKVASYPGVKVLTAGGKPTTLTTPNGTLHAVFVQDPDGFVVEMLEATNPPADAPPGDVIAGSSFEATVRSSEASVKFYNELLGFDLKLGTAFNSNQEMAGTAGAPGASFKQSTARIPGTAVPFTLIEFSNIERKELSGRTQDPGTTVLQLIVRDVAALTTKLGRSADRDDGWRAGAGGAGAQDRDRQRSEQHAARARGTRPALAACRNHDRHRGHLGRDATVNSPQVRAAAVRRTS
jgi:catechol 2,3-dioxygenase-like lactoylglutathione lyase family enzyme